MTTSLSRRIQKIERLVAPRQAIAVLLYEPPPAIGAKAARAHLEDIRKAKEKNARILIARYVPPDSRADGQSERPRIPGVEYFDSPLEAELALAKSLPSRSGVGTRLDDLMPEILGNVFGPVPEAAFFRGNDYDDLADASADNGGKQAGNELVE